MEANQINPNHYKASGMETWEMMLKIWGTEAFIKHCEMCAFKYRMRAGLKQGASVETDIAKANWYEANAKMLKGAEAREPCTNPHKVVEDEKGILLGTTDFGGNFTSGKIAQPKELIPVDSLVEVEADVNNDEEVVFYDTDGKKYTSKSKIKRIFLEMEK